MDASAVIEFRRVKTSNDKEWDFMFRTTKGLLDEDIQDGEFDLWTGDIIPIKTHEGTKKYRVLKVQYNPLNDNNRVYYIAEHKEK
ncbi:hypothetical protein HPX95_19320 [Bacillus tequilensis]|uniref:hypothetical protein n=1 Tax=Bacillus tequilensis TaxID=227866 RepID=UPI001574FBF8|nr:hypothetical protein [Bacillus tequilensis]NTU28289.1 hypothetical protein [Bacillus tequilensis]